MCTVSCGHVVCIVFIVTPTSGSAADTDADNVSVTQLVNVAVSWSGIYYMTADGRLLSRGKLNNDDDDDMTVQAPESQTSYQQCVQVSSSVNHSACSLCH